MPQRPSTGEPDLQPLDPPLGPATNSKSTLWGRLPFPKFANRKRNDGTAASSQAGLSQDEKQIPDQLIGPRTLADRRALKGVVAGLPRTLTLRRIDSEKRDRLQPHEATVAERRYRGGPPRRRAYSAMRPVKSHSPEPPIPRRSAPEQTRYVESVASVLNQDGPTQPPRLNLTIPNTTDRKRGDGDDDLTSPPPPLSPDDGVSDREEVLSQDLNDPEFQKELESTWILNLTMRFRDGSNREKFIITYAQQPTRWRRVTVSCDYRNAEPESLESNLKDLVYHRDKNAHIYDAIRESLPEIQYFPTVTNLKLETRDHRLHVHVTEDINEKIEYPCVSQIEHLALRPSEKFRESVIRFESHLSGFVYKVSVNGRTYIKKEIPSPDTVDEFLYEIDALYRLRDSKYVIKFRGVVIDEQGELIKGLLIDYAPKGSLADIIYDHPESPLSWPLRARWAQQIVQGLADIHEHGFVQGDFTLSNIVIDADDNVKIIDINRRGCPVGWEPPEFLRLIESGRRVSMFIGIKSDIFQMGMCLWGLAELCDEPDREEGDFQFASDSDTPSWFQEIVNTCLAQKPTNRKSAKELLRSFSASGHGRSVTHESGAQRSTLMSSDLCMNSESEKSREQNGRRTWSTHSQLLKDSLNSLELSRNSNDGSGPTPVSATLDNAKPPLRQNTEQSHRDLLVRALGAEKPPENGAGQETPTSFNPPLHQDSGFQEPPNIDLDLGALPPPDNMEESESNIIPQRQGQVTDDLAGIGGAGWMRNGS